jgi:single-stranded-DNA-specific exonuclease
VAKRVPGVLAKFGGHAFAAGLTLAESKLSLFATTFEAIAREQLTPAQLKRTMDSDGSLAPDELGIDLALALRDHVWGQGFPAPVFDDVFTVADQQIVGGKHSRFFVSRVGERHAAILFNHVDPLPGTIRAAYRPDVNEWNGTSSLQLVIEHWQLG